MSDILHLSDDVKHLSGKTVEKMNLRRGQILFHCTVQYVSHYFATGLWQLVDYCGIKKSKVASHTTSMEASRCCDTKQICSVCLIG